MQTSLNPINSLICNKQTVADRLSPTKTIYFVCFSESHLKIMENSFCIILKVLFYQDIKIFVLAF